ncbi:FliA/WhiG family RNA polymerase sigma factor [Acidipila sp. EB88]|nr:FliA/WhiG family RNA polymerase sigma factor [Acidipila sp. EB88]
MPVRGGQHTGSLMVGGKVPQVQRVTEPGARGLTTAQEQLLLAHLPIVRFVARAIHDRLPQHVELDELVSAGTLGLVDAARKFNPTKNVQYRSYAQFRVRGAILDSLRALDWSPRELRRKGRALHEAANTLKARLGREPQDAEVAAAMGLSLLHLQQLTGQLRSLEMGSLQTERGGEDGGDEELQFLPAKESENPLAMLLEGEARDRVRTALESLPAREREVMLLYYFEELTMREIGSMLGVVESRISQIHHMALRRLRVSVAELRGKPRGCPAPAAYQQERLAS